MLAGLGTSEASCLLTSGDDELSVSGIPWPRDASSDGSYVLTQRSPSVRISLS